MSPEPFPWDRREFRKQERSGSAPRLGGGGFSGGGPHRWREQHHHPPTFQQQHHQQRWYSDFCSPRLPPPDHGKHGGWHMYSDDAGPGFQPSGSRCADRNLVDEKYRPFGSRGDERYFRNNREFRNVWKAPSLKLARSPSASTKPITEVCNSRPIENTQQCSRSRNSSVSHPPRDSVNLLEQSQPQPIVKEHNSKNGGAAVETTIAGLESKKENFLGSLDWKPLKSARVGSLSSRGSCSSIASSSNSVGVGSTNMVAEVQPKNAVVFQSPSDDTYIRLDSPVLLDETGSMKKRRLGWGEGLAKYEKKRVEGPADGVHKNDMVFSVVTETPQVQSVDPPEKSPRVASLSDCASYTPSLVACSSSPDIEEKGLVKGADLAHNTTNLSCSPGIATQSHSDVPILNLENLELSSIANMSSSINELLQSYDPTAAEKGNVRNTSMHKLLMWKVEVLKALEMTELEIECLESELKSLIAECRVCGPSRSSSVRGEEQLEPFERVVTASECGNKLVPLQVDSSEVVAPFGPESVHVLSKDEDIDSPGTVTSKFVALPAICPSEIAEVTEGSMNLIMNNSRWMDDSYEDYPVYFKNHARTSITTHEDLAGVKNVHCHVDNVYYSILSSNIDAVSRSMEQLNKLLPKQLPFESAIGFSVSALQSNPSVKKKFLKKKQFLQFKEKILTLKFKVFQHFWKEGRVVSIRKLRGKAQKKFDQSGIRHKKNRSSLHPRGCSHAGGTQTVSVNEVIEYVNCLLSEFALKPYRSALKMPGLILDKDVKISRFISNNGLVEDPCAVEKERSMINPWTTEEKETFVDKLAIFGKDFGKIASFLDNKSVADCIEFYYKNHKSKGFLKTRKNTDSSEQGKSPSKMYLVASQKRRNPELNITSLDILGAASEMAAGIDYGLESQLKCPARFSYGACSSQKSPTGGDCLVQGSDSTKTCSNERENEAADVLASNCGSLSSEGVSSCITSSLDKPGDGYQGGGGLIINTSVKGQDVDDDDDMSDVSCGELDPSDWSDEEKSIFVQAVKFYGKDFPMISQCVGTRSIDECKVFFSKAKKCLELDPTHPGNGTALVDDSEGNSDVDDECTVQTGSVICNDRSECRLEETLPPPDMKLNQSDVVGVQNLRPKFEISEGDSRPGPLNSVASEPASKNSSVEFENKALVDVSDQFCGVENQQQVPSLIEGNFGNNIVDDRDANSSEFSDMTSVISETVSKPQPSAKVSQQHLLTHSSSDSIKSSQVLWGYPVSVQTTNDRTGDVSEKKTCVSDVTEQNGNMNSDQHLDFFLKKCNESRQQGKVVDDPFSRSSCSSAGEDPSGNGDVKLFGTVLVSAQQKMNNSAQQTDGNSRQCPKISRESLDLKLGAQSKLNLDSMQSKVDRTTYAGTHSAAQTYGYWDGSRTRQGIPPVPDSALLLAKYPSAFHNYAPPNVKLHHQPSLHGTVYPRSEVSSINGGLPNQEMQPSSMGIKRRRDVVFNEVHRINSYDLLSRMRSFVGRGVYVGGQHSSLTDPMAALQMHSYARMEQISMQGGNIINEDDNIWVKK